MYSFVHRLDRTATHLKSLEDETLKWLGGDNFTVTRELDPERGEYLIRVEFLNPPPGEIGAIIGDILHNLRSAIDNLVYELALAHTGNPLPPDIAASSAFPIYRDPAKFAERGQWVIRGIPPPARTVIEQMQPYHRGDKFNEDPLWALHVLSNIDKHRLPHLALLRLRSAGVSGLGGPLQERGFRFEPGPFDSGAVVARYPRFDESGAEVCVHFHVSFGVGLESIEGMPPWGSTVHFYLQWLYAHIAGRVLPRFGRFL